MLDCNMGYCDDAGAADAHGFEFCVSHLYGVDYLQQTGLNILYRSYAGSTKRSIKNDRTVYKLLAWEWSSPEQWVCSTSLSQTRNPTVAVAAGRGRQRSGFLIL